MFKQYYTLTKPGIIRGNLLTAAAGFFLAARGHIDVYVLVGLLAGVALVIGSGCVFNNYIDRDIDRAMKRTQKRALVTGSISARHALTFAAVLGLLGFAVLGVSTNLLTMFIGIVGFILYVVVYAVAKRKTVHGTVVGSLSGAIAPLAGYTAVTGRVDTGAVLLFVVVALWQMPHFYAIALYRSEEYRNAGIPVMPLVYGRRTTKWYILAYTVLFILACIAMTIWDVTGVSFALIMGLFGLYWLYMGIRGFNAADDNKWAKGMFGVSLLAILVLSVMLVADTWLP